MPASVSVLMPTFDQASFLARAVGSLLEQTFRDWELHVIVDGSPDHTRQVVEPFLRDPRVHYHRLPENRGLGAALNFGLQQSQASRIAYLPSDDVYHAEHLRTLVECLDRHPQAWLAYAGVRHHYNRTALGAIEGYPLQLAQVMHRRSDDRWIQREELVTDDLERMYWSRLDARGDRVGTDQVTCEWVEHPKQRHRLIREPVGGINAYRQRFGVQHPLRFHSTVGNRIDEVQQYRRYRERRATAPSPEGLKILLVGELAYNADRVLALEERGHRLYGLWMNDPYWYNTVGPLPFGHVEDLPRQGWQQAVRQLRADVIYALLNWQAVPFAHEVLTHNPGVPFVWHFKEGPFICREQGTWPQLVDLCTRSDGRIYCSPEMRDWFETVLPAEAAGPTLVLDGDLPKADWFSDERQPRLSENTDELHTVVPGRPIGLHPHTVGELAAQKIHLHFYGDFTHGQWRAWIDKARQLAANFLHLHAQIDQDQWVRELSRYDAGWLHFFCSENQGELQRANWDDLNYPARISTLLAAGLPLLQRDNRASIVASQSLARSLDLGLFFETMEELGTQLRQRDRMDALQQNIWRQRMQFTFDHHADRLIEFFRRVIQHRGA